eukprot:SAG22_NODE_21_length_31784_cov_15.522897_4_plen_71_part_00
MNKEYGLDHMRVELRTIWWVRSTAGPAPDGPTEEELAADAAEEELYWCRLEEKQKLEAMLAALTPPRGFI